MSGMVYPLHVPPRSSDRGPALVLFNSPRVMETLSCLAHPRRSGRFFSLLPLRAWCDSNSKRACRSCGRASILLQESEVSPRILLVRELDEYFAGERREFTFALDLRGTDFQLACWNALLEIPYGETRSYRDIAEAIGHPHAFRAVGMSNNRNPVAIVVPCHRVIASSGSFAAMAAASTSSASCSSWSRRASPLVCRSESAHNRRTSGVSRMLPACRVFRYGPGSSRCGVQGFSGS